MKKAMVLLALVVGGHLFWSLSHLEKYCFFYPGIDTQYAPGFSEKAFSQISTGMTMQTVQQKLGSPLYIQGSNSPNGELWFYTLDAKCKWGDWAWLCRQVRFREGRVVEVIKLVSYN